MDLLFILNILWKRKWLLLLTALLTTALTYFLLGFLPPKYKSETILHTGIIERRGVDLEKDNPFVQQFQVRSQFSNLTNRLKSRTSIRELSNKLLLHDLKAMMNNEVPFHTPNEEEWAYEAKSAKEIIELITQETKNKEINRKEAPKIRKIARAFEYDYESLLEELMIQRDGDTDYLKVMAISDNPTYSATLVNTLSELFTEQYNMEHLEAENTSVQFYSRLANNKKKEIDSLTIEISRYKQDKRIVDLEEEGSFLIAEKKDLIIAREEEKKNIEGLRKAVITYNTLLKEQGFSLSPDDTESILLRRDITALREEKANLQEQYNLTGRLDDRLQRDINAADQKLDKKLSELAAERIDKAGRKDNNENLKDIFFKRLDAEVDLVIAEESVKSIDNALDRIDNEAIGFVEDEAVLENLQGEKTIKTEEYLSIVSKLNDAKRIALAASTPLQIIEYGEVADEAEDSKAAIIAALAGIVATGALALLLIFLSLFDRRLTPQRFESLTELPLIGTIRKLNNKHKDLSEIFYRPTQQKEEEAFREDIRKIRHEIEFSGAKKLLFTSLDEQEGKTFLIVALSYALGAMKKKILIVDTNFRNNELTILANKVLADNPLFNGIQTSSPSEVASLETIWELDDNIHVLGNQGGDYSPSELLAGRAFDTVLDNTAKTYDYVFMEAPSMNKYSDTRELLQYTDKIITVFKANEQLTMTDKNSIAFIKANENKFLGAVLSNVTE